MASLWLVRHGSYGLLGKALGGRADHPLDEAGRHEAGRAGAWLAAAALGAVLSSPVRRARETAEILARHAGLPVIEAPDFSEIDFGEWSSRSFASLSGDPAWETWNRNRGLARVPGGETMLEAQLRSIRGLWRAAALAPSVAIVTHADIIRAIVLHILGSPLDFYDRLEIPPGSLTEIEFEAAQARVRMLSFRP